MTRLFPLNTILFPTIPIQLHIFEERYKEMVQDCMQDNRCFGVIQIKEGREAFDKDVQTFSVGTLAEIEQLQELPGGKYNLVARGRSRFHVQGFDHEKPYLRAVTTELAFTESDEIEPTQVKLLENHIAETLENNQQAGLETWPQQPVAKAYLAAHLLNVDLRTKQEILCINNADKLVNRVISLFEDKGRLDRLKYDFKKNRDYGPYSQN